MATIEMEIMKLEQFYKIPNCSVQRDTVAHATAALRRGGHLRESSPTQARVSIAKWGKRKSCVLDGHSRRYLWKEDLLEKPPKLFVDIYHVENEAEACALYHTFDNAGASEKPADRLYGAFRGHKFTPRTSLFRCGGTVTAMKVAVFPKMYSDISLLTFMELTEPWIETFKTIDNSFEIIKDAMIIPSWVMLGLMLTVRRDGAFAMSFWEAYAVNGGSKTKDSVDGIFATSYLYSWAKDNYIGKGGSSKTSHLTPLLLWYYDEWANQRRIAQAYVGSRVRYGPKFDSKDLPSLGKWWRDNLGEYDFPQLRSQADIFDED